ncbi:MAG: hypothetical protein LC778_10335 [Acidobacteria bacterium]|nr:hypothetical protein [Acidobacteriota bacterium]
MKTINARNSREWVIKKEIIWQDKEYGFRVEVGASTRSGVILFALFLLMLAIVFIAAPPGIPIFVFIGVILIVLTPIFYWILFSRRWCIIAASGSEVWSQEVRSLVKARKLEKRVIADLRDVSQPVELERIY